MTQYPQDPTSPTQPPSPQGQPPSHPSGQQQPGSYGQQPPGSYPAYAAPSPAPTYTPAAGSTMSPQDERTWAMVSHLAPFAGWLLGLPLLGPLVVFLIYKDRGPYVREQSAESLNFQLTLMIGYIISAILILVLVGFVMLAVLAVLSVVFQVLAALAANRGEHYRYPFTIRFVK